MRRLLCDRLWEQGGGWRNFLHLASDHGVLPLLWECIPPELAAELRAEERQRAELSLAFTAELLGVLDVLGSHGIRAVPFKGPAMADALYGGAEFRDCCDLDVLIRRQDARRAIAALAGAGYHTDLPVAAGEAAAYLRARHEIHFQGPHGILIELHQAFVAPFFSLELDYDALWQRMESRLFCGREILTLAPADLLLALCAHGTKHCWNRLIWICDVARLLSVHGRRLDWDALVSQAADLGARRMLLLGLAVARRVAGAALPPAIAELVDDDAAVARMAGEVDAALFGPIEPGEWKQHRFFLESRERLSDRMRYCGRLALTPTERDYSAVALPRALSMLYHPLHLFRVAKKYSTPVVRSLVP